MSKKNILGFLKKNWHLVLLLVLVGCAVFFAFYNFQFRYNLDDETIREAIIGIEGARQKQVPLVGGFSSAAPFTWGPWFYYQMVLASLIIPSFFAPWFYLGAAYILSVFVLYKIGEGLADKQFGLILAFLGTFSPALIIGATHLTFPNLITVFSLLSVLLFIKIIKKDVSYWWSFLFGLVLGIGINIHYQTASLLILPILMLIYKRKKVFYFLSFVVGAFLTFIPLLIFDLTNHWFNTKNVLYFYLHGKDMIYVPNRWLFYVRDFWPSLWADVIGIEKVLGFAIMLLVALILGYQLLKKKISTPILLLAIAFFIDFVAMRYYWGERFFGYFNFLRPYIFIFTGYVIYFIYKNIKYGKYITLGILIALFVVIFPKSLHRLNSDLFNKEMYKRVQVLEERYPDQKFTLYLCKDLYSGNDQRIPKSVLYLLEKDGRIAEDGMKIGVEKNACIKRGKKDKTITREGLVFQDPKRFPEIEKTDIYDLSKADPMLLEKATWEKVTMRSIYDSTTRWWFKEQP